MYKYFSLIILLTLISCDDGNFEIPSFEFRDTVNTCGNYVIYRMNEDQTEALILQLDETAIAAVETTVPIEVAITADNVQYRIFDNIVSSAYFCAAIPPVTPHVTRNWVGVSGASNTISIETSAVLDDNNEIIGYEHQITLYNLVLESNGESQTFENYYFGSFITGI